jgi:hypothetical protein
MNVVVAVNVTNRKFCERTIGQRWLGAGVAVAQ